MKSCSLELDVTPGIKANKSINSIRRMSGRSIDWVKAMMIDRRSSAPNSNMTAFALHQMVEPRQVYQCSSQYGVTPLEQIAPVDQPPLRRSNRLAQQNSTNESISQTLCQSAQPVLLPAKIPQHLQIDGLWDETAIITGAGENVLGHNVQLKVNTHEQSIHVPLVEADASNLAYYGAAIFKDKDRVVFGEEAYPLWKMQLGENYVDQYLMTEEGKGFYLEWHTDRPHWHQPVTPDCGGFYLLAKQVNSLAGGQMSLHLTAFHIPFGKAVFTPPGVIHCDAGLTGKNWIVGFTDSQHFSTALVRNAKGQMLDIKTV